MSYKKSYQEVYAGRVREDEAIAFFGQNKIALPPRVTSFNQLSAAKEPVGKRDYLESDSVGKPGTRVPAINNYLPNKPQLS